MGSTAALSNAAIAAAAALSNTAALVTGLGGSAAILPTFATVGLSAAGDGIVFSYQNPAGSINQTPRTLIITGVQVSSVCSTTLVGGPVNYSFSLAFGGTAVSLATAESATAKAPRRLAMGSQNYASAAAAGTTGGADIVRVMQSPIVVNPGEYIQLCARNLGSVTTAGVIVVSCGFDCYWE